MAAQQTPRTALANYIERGGEQSFLQPYQLDDTEFYGFFLQGNPANLQDLCDRYLNAPAQGAVDYRVLGSHVLLSFDRVGQISSELSPDQEKGHFSERGEVIFWVPVMQGTQRDGRFVAEKLGVFIPYIFVDSSQALVSGREVYGFPKEWGWIAFPSGSEPNTPFTLEAVAWQTFGPDNPGVRQPILEVNSTAGDRDKRPWNTFATITQDMLDLLFPHGIEASLPDVEIDPELCRRFFDVSFPSVFLKQFRDVEDGTKACYQAIIEANNTVNLASDLESGAVLGDSFTVTIHHLESHPIIQDLGLVESAPGQFQAQLPFWLKFNFQLQAGQILWESTPAQQRQAPAQKKKIAVLGGGLGAMTTVFHLTEQPDWQDYYDITVYQMGWRLGGKGASGRNVTPPSATEVENSRIQEHGFHIFFGFYKNAFTMMRKCYDGMIALEGSNWNGPMSTIEDAYQPHNYIVLEEEVNGQWEAWNLDFPANDLLPWEDNGPVHSLFDHIRSALQFTYALFTQSSSLKNCPVTADAAHKNPFERFQDDIQKTFDLMARLPELIGITIKEVDLAVDSAALFVALEIAETLAKNSHLRGQEAYGVLSFFLDRFRDRIQAKIESLGRGVATDIRRDLIIINFVISVIIGLIDDGIVADPERFPTLDDQDFAQWLRHHGAAEATLNSPLVRSMYDLLFAFREGVNTPENQDLGTAAALYWGSRMTLFYEGAVMWKMQAGMGDTIFTPFYRLLKERGVTFEFFHRVTELDIDSDDPAGGVTAINLVRQVNLKNPEQGYNPLIEVNGLSCWPAEPLYDQIVEGDQLQAHNINLESFWTPWPTLHDEEPITLTRGTDFDIVVLGIALGALPYICPQLIAASPAWRDMTQEIKTVTTQGGQLWFQPTLGELGWNEPSPVLGTYVEPLDTYADMTDLIPKEAWSAAQTPQSLAYFTGTMTDPGIPDATDYEFPAQQQALVEAEAIAFLNSATDYLWPDVMSNDEFNWDLLVAPDGTTGLDRFSKQYWRINISPTERYVMSVAGSQNYRLKPGESGFAHLYLTGDWLDNEMNSGCVEATVMVGMEAAATLCAQEFGLTTTNAVMGIRQAWC